MDCVCNMWVGLAMGAVLRALCRVAVLRVLTAYIPRTPGPKKATRALPKPGLLPLGACNQAPRPSAQSMFWDGHIHVWNIYGTCVDSMQYVWRVMGYV